METRNGVGSVPRGIEVLVKKAAVDLEFKALLLAERSGAAAEIGLELNDAEAAMLDGVPAAQLEAIIANTTVSAKMRPAFAGRVAAVMLAALGAVSFTAAEDSSSPDEGSNGIGEPGTGSSTDNENVIISSGEYEPPRVADATGIRPGTINYSINAVIKRHSRGIQTLYLSEVEKNPSLGNGEVIVKFAVSEDGYVSDALVVDSSIDSPGFESKIITKVLTWRFPAAGFRFSYEYAFIFVNTD